MEYLRARYYDQSTGRFLSRDPLSIGPSYAYAANSPCRFIDPTGLTPGEGSASWATMCHVSVKAEGVRAKIMDYCNHGGWALTPGFCYGWLLVNDWDDLAGVEIDATFTSSGLVYSNVETWWNKSRPVLYQAPDSNYAVSEGAIHFEGWFQSNRSVNGSQMVPTEIHFDIRLAVNGSGFVTPDIDMGSDVSWWPGSAWEGLLTFTSSVECDRVTW
jgi:hypothetical protein